MHRRTRSLRKPAVEQRIRAERRAKPSRSQVALEVLCLTALQRVRGLPPFRRIVVARKEPGEDGRTSQMTVFIPERAVEVAGATRAALEQCQDRHDLAR